MRARFAYAVAVLAAGCSRREPPPSAPPEPIAAPSQLAHSAYRTELIARGGTIRGHVRWDGARPSVAAMPVPDNANPSICGASQTPPVLRVSDAGAVQYAVLSLRDVTHGKAPALAPIVVDQRGCQYVPHLVAGVLEQPIRFTSSDPTILHTVRSYHGYQSGESWFTRPTPSGVAYTTTIDHDGVSTLYCDSGHTWMLGYVVGFAHPYFAVTPESGDYVIDEIPSGSYTLRAWHEGFAAAEPSGGRIRFGAAMESDASVVVEAGTTLQVNWVLSATGLRREP